MKVLVTGGAGFIGSHVVDKLHAHGHEALIFDRQRNRISAEDVFLGDVMDDTAVTEAMAHVDAFIHLAACLGTQETIKNPRPAAMTNIMGGLNVLEAASLYNVAGTYIGVGNHWMNNSYSISKTTVERYVHLYNEYRDTRVNIVRAMNAYGERQTTAPPFGSNVVRKITPAFACRALCGMPIEVYGDGEQVSDMVYVGDVAEALVRATEKAVQGQVFDTVIEIGPEHHRTVNQVATSIAQVAALLTGKPPVPIEHLPMRPGETVGSRVVADISTLVHVDMQVSDLVPVESGIPITVEWFADNEGSSWHRP